MIMISPNSRFDGKHMNKGSVSVKSSSVSSESNAEKGFFSFFSRGIIYHIPNHKFWGSFRLFNLFCLFSLSVDPDYALGKTTKSVLHENVISRQGECYSFQIKSVLIPQI